MITSWRLTDSLQELFNSRPDDQYWKLNTAQEQCSGGLASTKVRPRAYACLRRLFTLSSRRPWMSITAILAAVLVATAVYRRPAHGSVATRQQQTRYLYLLIPGSRADAELCKTVLTAQILGYPPPHLIHWDASFDSPDRTSLRYTEKLRLTRDFLQQLPEHAQDGMVVLLDGPNSWFQLRPDVLLNRYFEIVEEANGRLYDSLPSDMIAEDDLEPSIVFSAQDHCIAGTEDLPSCYGVPQAPRAQAKRNLRWLNMGSAVGPVRNMLALFRRAVAKAEKLESGVHDHEIMSEIFGEQELQHEILRSGHSSWWRKAADEWLGRGRSSATGSVGEVQYKEGAPDEFGITLDYANELGLSVASGIDDMAWSKHNRVPADIAQSMPPYWTISGYKVPNNATWSDIGLLTDHRSDSVPAIISFNDDKEYVSDLHQKWWQNIWLQPQARDLYDSAAMMPNLPSASVLDGSGTEHTFWPATMRMEKAGVRSLDGTWIGYEQLCGDEDIARELFGDGLGLWTDPAP
ncbi:hypothetical protein Tdes44962_MAKER05391 [Teratosphaeria destructans]|uniref:Uncharacterized protein n=1 Tax=Teratosphaeria destructans TaxID=418781 RepID=A0A9W7SK34_9PEZI|nr:hypothetical protein Tdes44962_MAKER05391 [Teratosphaeria destructans]